MMNTTAQAPSKALLRSLKSGGQRPRCRCSRSKRLPQPQQQRWQTTSTSQQDDKASSFAPQTTSRETPRWAQTPPAMKAPVRARPKKPDWKPFPVNSDPRKLDLVYESFLGRTGPKMLGDETKWLAVTHKSFDHGRRGFNDRLSLLGKTDFLHARYEINTDDSVGRQIVELQTSLALLTAADISNQVQTNTDPYGRQPFQHPATDHAEVLIGGGKDHFLNHMQLSGLASRYGLPGVVRWQPKDVSFLFSSTSLNVLLTI